MQSHGLMRGGMTIYTPERERQALQTFGAMLRRWRIRNGWTQYTLANWGREAGLPAPAAGNLSNLERGRGKLMPSRLFQLAEFNRRVAAADWSGVTGRELRDQLEGSEPIRDAEGLWEEQDLWACSVGLLAPPAELAGAQQPLISDRDAARLSDCWRQRFADCVATAALDPSDALRELGMLVPIGERLRLRQVLAIAGQSYQAAELSDGWDEEWLPERALREWEHRHHCSAAEACA